MPEKKNLKKIIEETAKIDPLFRENITMLNTYLKEQRLLMSFSDHTMWNYFHKVVAFLRFLRDSGKQVAITAVTRPLIVDYAEHIMSHTNERGLANRNQTIRNYLMFISPFFTWMVDHELMLRNPVPKHLMVNSAKVKPPEIVPGITEIRRVRNRADRLIDALAFELSISSGMRKGEIMQIREDDIQFGESVLDTSTGKPNVYIGGKIDLRLDRHRIKRNQERSVYFSLLCAELLAKYLKDNPHIKGNMPLFPYRENWANRRFDKIAQLIYGTKKERDARAMARSALKRKRNFQDIKITDEQLKDAPADYIRSIKARQKIESVPPIHDESNILSPLNRETEVARPEIMHPHALRHTFACLMWYRDWFGTKHNIAAVRDLLGHSKGNISALYLSNIHVVANDDEWQECWVGRSMEYISLLGE